MFAMLILAIGLLAIVSMLGIAIQANGFSSKMSLATRSAQEKIEELKNAPFLTVVTDSDAEDADGLTRSWTVTDNTPILNNKTIVVDVTWVDEKEASKAVQFSTVIAP
jgi:Tfp pilus assembly protein PilV